MYTLFANNKFKGCYETITQAKREFTKETNISTNDIVTLYLDDDIIAECWFGELYNKFYLEQTTIDNILESEVKYND